MNARKTILDILVRVFHENGYASLMMRSIHADEADMAFISETVYGTIRNYSLLEYQWRHLSSKTKKRTALLIDMSIYQIFFMQVPDYAAVSEAVELAGRHEKTFVNAILRQVIKEGMQMPEADEIRLSHPAWILNLWKAHYGEEAARLIAEHDQKKSVSYGRINTLRISKEELENAEGIQFVTDIAFTYDGRIQKTEWFRQGKVLIQDLSSQEPVKMLDPEAGMRVLDACAAPGTKTQQIAMMMGNTGSVTAGELHAHRRQLIDQLMEKTGVSIVHSIVNDASKENAFEEESFDRILIDAPCSGLGDLSHKPEIRWHLRPEDIDDVTAVQKKILDANAPYLKRGGILVYSTCTLNRKENESMIAQFLKKYPGYSLLKQKTCFPYEKDSDGFYMAKLTRT